jgi:ankyrin repeat protein
MKASHVLLISLSAVAVLWTGALNSGATQEPDPPKPKPVPALIVAVRHGDHARIKELLAKDADPAVTDPAQPFRPTPAWAWAVFLGDLKGKSLLPPKGVTADSLIARVTLPFAASRGDLETAKALLDKGTRADASFRDDQRKPLLIAAGNGDRHMVVLLLEKGADPNRKNDLGDTALMAAARTGNANLIQALLAKNADVAAKDDAGRTALSWAVRSDEVEAAKLLLESGADVNAADKDGRTPLTLAARRDNANVVELLRKHGAKGEPNLGAGAPASPRAAVEKSLPLLQRGAESWLDRKVNSRGCISCHHQGMIVGTTALAKERGFKIDEQLALAQAQAVARWVSGPTLREARKGVDERLRRDYDGDLAFQTALFLSELLDGGWKADTHTAGAAQVVAESQWLDGHWNHGMPRIPIGSSDFTATALAVRVLRAYGANDAAANEKRFARAREWLLAAAPRTTDDKAFRLNGLHWAGADAAELTKAARRLLADQRPDGGWAQAPELASDAYATGQALVALHRAGGVAVEDEAYRRGVKYLLRTQEDDGSWLVPTRSVAFNRYFDSGYPHGKFQFISFAGSGWATRALILAAAPAERKARP